MDAHGARTLTCARYLVFLPTDKHKLTKDYSALVPSESLKRKIAKVAKIDFQPKSPNVSLNVSKKLKNIRSAGFSVGGALAIPTSQALPLKRFHQIKKQVSLKTAFEGLSFLKHGFRHHLPSIAAPIEIQSKPGIAGKTFEIG